MGEHKPDLRHFARIFAIELVIYGVLLTVYFLFVLRFLNNPLQRLFNSNLVWYGLASLGLIVAQGVLLDLITSLLVHVLGVGRSE